MEGFDPAAEMDRREETIDERTKDVIRRRYVRTATQDGMLVSVTVQAAGGSSLTWKDIEALGKDAKKLLARKSKGV
jgi:hypothetical protein